MISFCAGWRVVALESVEILWMFAAVGVAVERSTGGRVTGGARLERGLRRKRWNLVNIFVAFLCFWSCCVCVCFWWELEWEGEVVVRFSVVFGVCFRLGLWVGMKRVSFLVTWSGSGWFWCWRCCCCYEIEC